MIIADLVLYNGKIASVDEDFSFHQAVAVKDGWIIDVGENEAIKSYIGENTKVIDLNGRVLLPAANDAHMHATLTGLMLADGFLQVGDPSIGTVKELQNRIAACVKEAKPGQWIYGSGFLEFMLEECNKEGRGLTRYDLDVVSPDHPVILNDFGLHTLVANSKALEIAGITKDYRQLRPEEGIIERDENGVPNGRLFEWSAHDLIAKFSTPVTEEEIQKCIMRTHRALNEQGITAHTDILGRGLEHIFLGVGRERAIHVYEKMRKEGKLNARVSIAINPCEGGVHSFDATLQGLENTQLPDFGDENFVKAKSIKLFGDHGMWLRPREDRPNGEGRSVFSGQSDEEQITEMKKIIMELHRRGWQVCIHAIGGKTIDAAVDAFCEAQMKYPRQAPRHFIIHGDDMTHENAIRMGKYKISCSPQPIAARLVAGMNAPRMTAKDELFDWQSYKNNHVVVAGGSDSPCFSFNWREGVQFAVTRTTVMGQTIRPDLAMSMEDAIRMYTIDGARQECQEDIRGSIEINKVADFQILGEDIFTVSPDQISQIPIDMTIFHGKVVYERETL